MLRLPGVPIIYLGRRSPGASSNLPPGIGRATLDCRYTWSCNPRDVLSEAYRYLRGGLLPRLFTLTVLADGGRFLLRLPFPRENLPVRKRGALRCPDFPPLPYANQNIVECIPAPGAATELPCCAPQR